ncbi:hypothetical protein ACFLXE_01885 [Chloroflexota bacterium]
MVADPTHKFVEFRGASPEETKFFYSGGLVEVAAGTWFVSVAAGRTAFEADDGFVLVDSGPAGLYLTAPQTSHSHFGASFAKIL